MLGCMTQVLPLAKGLDMVNWALPAWLHSQEFVIHNDVSLSGAVISNTILRFFSGM